jgi:hypothetical protein
MLDDLDLRHADNINRLQEEWSSEQMQAKFSKPSPGLIELRRYAKSLMAAGRFDEAIVITNEITDREAREADDATQRMVQAYRRARVRLDQQFELEKQAACESYDVKLLGLAKEAAINQRALTRRLEQIHERKSELEYAEKRARSASSSHAQKQATVPIDQEPLVVNRKLKLPAIAFMTDNSTL